MYTWIITGFQRIVDSKILFWEKVITCTNTHTHVHTLRTERKIASTVKCQFES